MNHSLLSWPNKDQICLLQVWTLSSQATMQHGGYPRFTCSPWKTTKCNIKDRKYFRHAIAILTIISLRTSDGFWHNVAEFSKGKNKEDISFVVCCENVIGCVISKRISRTPQIHRAATSISTIQLVLRDAFTWSKSLKWCFGFGKV